MTRARTTLVLLLLALPVHAVRLPAACSWLDTPARTDATPVSAGVTALLTAPDTAARIAAARMLGRTTVLRAPDAAGRRARFAAEKDPRTALVIALDDPSPGVRLAAACALGRHGDARALVPLERRRADAPAEVRAAIDTTLMHIRSRLGPALLLRGATLLDGTGAPPRADMAVLIEGGVITRVGPGAELAAPAGAQVLDVTGRWITPGLWDMHVHLGKLGPESLPLFVATGVTSVRDMGGDADAIFRLRARVAAGELVGPRIVAPGPMLEAPATLERIASKPTIEPWQRTRIAVPDAAVAAHVVDSVAALGVDFIKIRETIDLATYVAIATAARRARLPVAGHAPFGLDPEEGARLGLTTFEHASYPYPLDTVPAARARVLRAFREGGTAVVPTMVAWSTRLMHPDSIALLAAATDAQRDPRVRLLPDMLLQEWRYELADMQPLPAASLRGWCGFINRTLDDLAAMHRAGIAVLPGTDAAVPGLFPGWSLHDELEVLVSGGVMSAADALRAATSRAALHAGKGSETGTIEPGRRADLLVLRADPSRNITALRALETVVLDGVVLDAARLAALRGGNPLVLPASVKLLPGVRDAGCHAIAMQPGGR